MRRLSLPVLTILLAACGSAAATPSTPRVSPASAAAPSSNAAAAKTSSALASTSAAPASGATAKLVVGFSQYIPQYLPLWVAQDAGIYAKNGLDVDQHMLSSTTGLTALIAGEVQINVGGGPELVSAGAGGADVVGVANLTPVSAFKFEASKSIQTKQDLVGKKIGISRFGSNTDTSTRALLTREGLDPEKDVTYIQMDTSSNTTAGLIAGSIQAALSTPPNTLTLEANGLHPLYDLAAEKIPGVDAIVETRRSRLSSDRDVMQRFIDSLIQSMARMRQDKALTEATLKKNMKLEDQSAIDSVYSFFVGSVFPTLPYLQANQYSDMMPVLIKQSEKLKGYDVSQVIDSSLVKSAADRGLGK